jgi:hypothetical protein
MIEIPRLEIPERFFSPLTVGITRKNVADWVATIIILEGPRI